MFARLWIIVYLTLFSKHADCQGSFNFPDNPQPTPPDSSEELPDLEGMDLAFFCSQIFFLILKTLTGRQASATIAASATTATTLPTFPTLATNIVTPVGQTCICVPTNSCNTTGQGSPGGEGLIDIRIVTNVVVSEILFIDLTRLQNIFSFKSITIYVIVLNE